MNPRKEPYLYPLLKPEVKLQQSIPLKQSAKAIHFIKRPTIDE
jgi:hypothetical protein